MTIVPITMNIVNWRTFIQAVQQEQDKHVTDHLDRAGISLDLPSSYVSAIGNLGQNKAPLAYSERLLHHLHFGFYYSMDYHAINMVSVLTDLILSDFDGYGIVSGTFLQWRDGIVSMLTHANSVELAIAFYKVFESAGLDRYFKRETKDDIRKKDQAAGR